MEALIIITTVRHLGWDLFQSRLEDYTKGNSTRMGHLYAMEGLPASLGLPSEPVWGYLHIRKWPHPQARYLQVTLMPVFLPSPSVPLAPPHSSVHQPIASLVSSICSHPQRPSHHHILPAHSPCFCPSILWSSPMVLERWATVSITYSLSVLSDA